MTERARSAAAAALAPPALPTFWQVHAPDSWAAIDFVSDLHLAADMPRTVDAFSTYLRETDADAVFILGDLFEVWVGDDARHEGFEAQCAELLGEAASRRALAFMPGNRDFLVGVDFLKACGVMALADPTVLIAFDERMLLSHGDALCLADEPYQRFRAEVRSTHWRDEFLARPLAARRKHARDIRAESERRKRELAAGRGVDIDFGAAVRWMHECGAPTLIHGHTHAPGSDLLAPGFSRHVLSDWDLDHPHHGKPHAEVLRWQRSGLSRRAPTAVTVR